MTLSTAAGLVAIAVSVGAHALAVFLGSLAEQRTLRKIHREQMEGKRP